jgi:hypothetical protein
VTRPAFGLGLAVLKDVSNSKSQRKEAAMKTKTNVKAGQRIATM